MPAGSTSTISRAGVNTDAAVHDGQFGQFAGAGRAQLQQRSGADTHVPRLRGRARPTFDPAAVTASGMIAGMNRIAGNGVRIVRENEVAWHDLGPFAGLPSTSAAAKLRRRDLR